MQIQLVYFYMYKSYFKIIYFFLILNAAMLTGIFVGLGIIEPHQNGEYEYKCRLAGIISTLFILMISILLLLKET